MDVFPRTNINISSVVTITKEFEYVDNVLEYFESLNIKSILQEYLSVFIVRLKIKDIFHNPSSIELNELGLKCATNSIVILLVTDDGNNYFLYWKSKDIKHFMTFKIYDRCRFMNNVDIFEFIAQFLVDSLRHGHLGKFK